MARAPRLVIPGVPHHVTQRGNRSQVTFFGAADFKTYRTLLGQTCQAYGVRLLAYCLMPNHIHAILVPETEPSLARAAGRISEAYSRILNSARGWKGHLWQGRFYSCPMGDTHVAVAARYVLLNPVRAGLVSRPGLWPWSSFSAHEEGRCPYDIVDCSGLETTLRPWIEDGCRDPRSDEMDALRLHTRTGRPLGDEAFLDELETRLGRPVRRQRSEPKVQARKLRAA